uniref:protein S100-A16-like n=1 Tax=Euleptes europaea TaxID=460621 RepID=UPI002540471B|nr:protein S100-A16-like [Euleptes europaea]
MMAGELSELEEAIETLVKNYDKYASKGFRWWKRGISKDNFQKMLSQELHHALMNTENRQAIEDLRRYYDKNQDGLIAFEEYWTLMGSIAQSLLAMKGEPEQDTSK